MKITAVAVGPIQSNCYVVWDEKSGDGIVIDPGGDAGKIMKTVEEREIKIGMIVCTHAHFDHVGAVAEIKRKTGAKVAMSREDMELLMYAGHHAVLWGFQVEQPGPPDTFLSEGDEIAAGNMKFRVLSTPGHSPGGICLLGEGVLFTGDTVFAGSVGRTDLPGGNSDDLKKSFSRIIALPPDTKILPGHGPETTVGEEKETNFFVHEL